MSGDDASLPIRRRGLFEPLSRKEEMEEEIIFLLTHHRYTPNDIQIPEHAITPETPLTFLDMNDEDIYIVFAAILEKEFEIKLDHVEVGRFKTVKDIAETIYPLLPEVVNRVCAEKKTEPAPYVPSNLFMAWIDIRRQGIENFGYLLQGINPKTLKKWGEDEAEETAQAQTKVAQTIAQLRQLKIP